MKDSLPSVRRSALQAIPAFCSVLKHAVILSEIVRQGLVERMIDDDETIRVIIPECLPAIARKINRNDRHTAVVPIAKILVKDSSWLVRMKLAKAVRHLVSLFDDELINSDLGAILLFLLRDDDPEVKVAACRCCRLIAEVLVKEQTYFSESVMPEIIEFASSRYRQVREEVARDLCVFARYAPEPVMKERLSPLFVTILSDTDRCVVIAFLRSLGSEFANIDAYRIMQLILPKLIEPGARKNFRIKVEIIELFPLFLPYLSHEAISSQFIPLMTSWLQDSFFMVREAACKILPKVLTIEEGGFIRESIIALLHRLYYAANQAIRQIALYAAWHMLEAIPKDVISEQMLPSAVLMAGDPVPNVRLLSAKLLMKMKRFVHEGKRSQQLSMCLYRLSGDPDPDVRYFAVNTSTVDFWPTT
jgi:serine/threonine-protein phosphatase 2A regulatory subunit A